MQLPEFLTETEGEVLLRGHRIGLYHVVRHYNDGDSAEMLACHYPTIGLSLIHKVIAFYLDHRDEVDAYVAECQRTLDEQASAGQRLNVNELRQRLERLAAPEAKAKVS